MEIKEVSDEKRWNRFVLDNQGGFLQSWQWGEFKSSFQEVLRVVGVKKDKEVVGCQVFVERLPLGSYLYCPYGPVGKKEELTPFLAELKKARREDFIRLEPLREIDSGVPAFSRHQPKRTLIKKLTDKEGLISKFDKDTRYSIRRAKREGVEVVRSEDVNQFYSVLQKASERHGFNTYSKDYFQKLIEVEDVELFVALYQKEVAAAAFISFFNKRATYLHAGMNYEKRFICAPTLLNYEIMNFSFKNGYEEYDFWGIDEKEMPGVTKFKKGFGGEEVSYPEAKDIPIKKIKYRVYKNIHSAKSRL